MLLDILIVPHNRSWAIGKLQCSDIMAYSYTSSIYA